MSKINAVRLINLNYNNNAIRISDETFQFHGESTLISLRNGGGKSVLVQMMMAPFVHRRYQNAKDRPFASYFTTNKPTFILVEWKLDQEAGYVLTGMMVRRSQEIQEERQDELEMINFIAEYHTRCQQDIYHLPVVEKTKKEITLKGFAACKQLFENYKRERSIPFFYFDMNNTSQSRQYFNKLAEYRIHYKEWESIIKKVNLKESGLSDLFADCRDEKGLVEKWFLEAVENKLNQDRNRMKEFQDIMEKYTGQYKDNRSKIQRRDTIRAFEREAEGVREHALTYREISLELEGQKNRIADFIGRLHGLEKQEQQNAEAARLRITELIQQLEELEYKKLSGEFYQISDRESASAGHLEMLRIEETALERQWEEINRRLQILNCAKHQERVEECVREQEQELQRLALCREKQENLEPERMRLGGLLRQYYDDLYADNERERTQCGDTLAGLEKGKAESLRKLEELRKEEGLLIRRCGELDARTKMFDATEDRFNQEYSVSWNRNILGEYEPGELQIAKAEYEKTLSSAERARTEAKREAEQYKEQLRSLRRLLEDKTGEKSRLESAGREAKNRLQAYEEELAQRRVTLRCFGMGEEDLFDTEKILATVQRRLQETDLARQGLEKEADALEKEYRKMAQGEVLELSEEFRGLLEEAGIRYVYGMEWLKKNQFSEDRNKRILEAQPFLPYSLILSEQELERLSGLPEQVYTASPIPILLREELEQQGKGEKETIHSFGKVHFYVWFNDNLLDEKKLKVLLEEQEIRIRKLQKAISNRKAEYQEYIGHQEKNKGQKVSREIFEQAQAEIQRLEKENGILEQEILQKREELDALEGRQIRKEQQAAQLEQEIFFQRRRLSDFVRFCESYEEYRENCRILEKTQKDRERMVNLQKLEQGKIERLEQTLVTERNRMTALEREGEICGEKRLRYRQYPGLPNEEPAEGIPEEEKKQKSAGAEATQPQVLQNGKRLSKQQAKEAETRFEVITSGIGAEQRELEERVERAGKHLEKAWEELNALAGKYGFRESEWAGVRYDRKEENHQEALQEEQDKKLRGHKGMVRDAEIQCALLEQEKKGKLAQLKERCGREEPAARETVKTISFQDAIRGLEYEREEAEKEEKRIEQKLRGYESNLAALAEYEDFVRTEPAEWETDPAAMTGAELTKLQGILIRDYHGITEQRRESRTGLERMLNRMIRMESFSEEFYQKPLDAMLQLTQDPERVLRQLEITTASYDSLMEKLQIDISLVEKEKAKISELVEEYLKEVHENLSKIDRNSTITVRERPVKMLKIEVPDWTENENLYRLRLQDYIEEVTARGITLLEENGNLQEFLGTRITTKGLYDSIVGIGSVQIRLYKIEAQREYPITWADVAKNSGGEGFLSAFVILSALLYYMRRDDSDLFADRNEGKVLLMDNPFAQTNASHLLKPLMDMAKKANTQLICLSGLGGESIYNRFDNIYVLTLIAANLRNDMQYLKAEHMRGSEEETMLVSQIEVMEQQELLF